MPSTTKLRPRSRLSLGAVFLAAATGACHESTAAPPPATKPIATSLRITLSNPIATGDTVTLVASTLDAAGGLLPNPPLAWSTADSLTAIVTSSSVIGRALGTTTISVHSTDGSNLQTSTTVTVRLVLDTIVAGAYHNCGIARGGVVHCWGEGGWGRLGTGVAYPYGTPVPTPAPILASARFSSIAGDKQQDGRSGHTCAVSSTAAAYCWGSGAWGMLANGQHGEAIPPYMNPLPTALAGVGTVKEVGAGAKHTCLLTTAGAAYCAGDNFSDQDGVDSVPELCEGSYPCTTHLTAVQGGHIFVSLVVGGHHACGLTSSGDRWCWGDNGFRELGAGSTVPMSAIPLEVTGVKLASVSAGALHDCGLDAGGVAYCWGYGADGQQGNGESGAAALHTAPTRVSSLQTFASIYAGHMHTCALTGDGTAYCWGANQDGQLGYATTTMCGDVEPCSTSPQPVNTTLRFVSLALGIGHTCGLVHTGEVYCWGDNELGQLGNGTTQNSTQPQRVIDIK
jgi:alpha-tubulin suppressor-like RCC1 family protein